MLNAEVVAGIPEDVTEKLDAAIDRYIGADTARKRTNAKKALIKLVCDRAEQVGNDDARVEFYKVLLAKNRTKGLPNKLLPDELVHCFSPHTFYEKGDRVIGWWADGEVQVHAEELPLVRSAGIPHSYGCSAVSFDKYPERVTVWRQRGFEKAEQLPIVSGVAGITVYFPWTQSQLLAEHGYARPCELPWHRDSDGLFVDRSIIEHGFWQAWKWWGTDTRWWYLEHRPELFAKLDWWGTEEEPIRVRHEPPNDPYAAVLGGKSEII
jgi:hypothetical protein